MVLFNYSTKEITAKIVYYGPGLCGKTTNLQFIYDSLPQTINKGKMLSLATKTDRTLFFDFLPIDLGTIRGMRTRLQLYTVPGQVFYNTTRKLVLKGADGVVFVADSQKRMLEANLESFGNLEENLAEHDMKLSDIPMILQFNKRDLPDVATLDELNAAMNKYNAPIYEAVAPTGIGVHETLKAITRLVLNSLKERYADKREQKADSQARASALMAASSSTSPVNARAAISEPSPKPAPVVLSEPVAPPQTAPKAQEMPVMASHGATPAPPSASTPAASSPQSDSGPLSFDLPEMEELSEHDAMPTGESFGTVELNGSEPEPMSVDSSLTEMMSAMPAGLDSNDDLLELAPEADLSIEATGDDLLELADEPLADLAHLEDSVAMPLLDVTSELGSDDEPGPLPAGGLAGTLLPVTADMSYADALDSGNLDNSAQLQSMLLHDSAIEPVSIGDDAFEDSLLEADSAGAMAPEDHHDTPLPVAEFGSSPALASIPLAIESVAQSRGEGSAGVSAPAMNREINLPVKLEIGGRCISFELKISLDLTEIAAYAGSTPQDEREARS